MVEQVMKGTAWTHARLNEQHEANVTSLNERLQHDLADAREQLAVAQAAIEDNARSLAERADR